MLAKAATKENKSTFTSWLNKKITPEGKFRPKGLEILKRNCSLRVFGDTCHQNIDCKITVFVI